MAVFTSRRLATMLIVASVAVGLSGCAGESSDPEPSVTATESAVTSEATLEPTADATEAPETEASGDQGEVLAAYVADAQAAVPILMENFAGTYSDIKILAVGDDTLEFAYTYETAADPASTAASLDTMVDSLQSVADTSVIPEMENAGITVDPKVRYTYYNPDGSLVWTHDFARSQ